jgi:hypothetical protein
MNRGQQPQFLRQGRQIGHFGRALANAGVMGAVGVLCLLLFGLAAPSEGRAASDLHPVHTMVSPAAHSFSETMTVTVFLPLVYHAPSTTTNMWSAEYYDNANLAGDPVYTAQEKRVDYDWGKDSSPPGLPLDNFSIRWTGDWDFEYGIYTFFVYADDGVRLWLDDSLLIDSWQAGLGSHQATPPIITAGPHELRLEYFEKTGSAAIRLGWRRTDLYPQWQGTYYNNSWVESPKGYEQTDSTIEFDWGDGCPDNLSDCNNFSIGWQATPVFEAGTHRFYIYADEGYQLYVDGSKVKEGGWYDGESGGSQDTYYDLTVSTVQYYNIRFNFHDRGGPAEARLWIQARGEPDWTAEYYDNKTLSGTPVKTKEEEAVFYDWGTGKPVSALPGNDSFSVRWSGQRYFHAGCYRFGLFADDGVRLWVDGELLVDQWHDGRGEYHSAYTYLTTGYHDVIIEYYENSGEAEIRFWWE